MNAKILIVDDDPVAMGILEQAMKRGGFVVARAYGAEDALRKLKLFKPEIVLTDLEMPKINGVQLISMIREDPATVDTPIIAVTAHAWDTIGQAAAQVGCDGLVSKPFSAQQLVEKVHECLAAREAAAPSPPQMPARVERAAALAAPVRREAAGTPTGPPVARSDAAAMVFDRNLFLEYVDGNLEQAQRVIGVLLALLPGRVEAIRKAVASQDSDALRTAAHVVKGSVSFFAAPAVVAAAFRLEVMGRAGDTAGAGSVYFELERSLGHLVEALNEFVREIGEAPADPKAADAPVKLRLIRN